MAMARLRIGVLGAARIAPGAVVHPIRDNADLSAKVRRVRAEHNLTRLTVSVQCRQCSVARGRACMPHPPASAVHVRGRCGVTGGLLTDCANPVHFARNPCAALPQAVVASVAARSPEKARAFAAEHGIPRTHDSYEARRAALPRADAAVPQHTAQTPSR